jgi:hypothetical protein
MMHRPRFVLAVMLVVGLVFVACGPARAELMAVDGAEVSSDDLWNLVAGGYAATTEGGPDDNEVTIFYDPGNGNIFVELNQLDNVTGIKLLSDSGIFTGPDLGNVNFHPTAMFTRAIPEEVSSAAFGVFMVGDRDYGNIAEPGRGWELLEDLTLYYTIAGTPGNQEAKLFVIPEPGTWVLLTTGMLGLLLWWRRKRA